MFKIAIWLFGLVVCFAGGVYRDAVALAIGVAIMVSRDHIANWLTRDADGGDEKHLDPEG